MQNTPLVVFDIDGTLAKTVEVDDLCFVKTFHDLYDLDLGEIDWSSFPHVTDLGVSQSIFLNTLNLEPTSERIEKTRKHFAGLLRLAADSNPEYFTEIEGAVAFFELLKRKGFPLAIATGGWGISSRFKLDQIGLDYSNVPYANSDDHFSRGEITKLVIEKARERYKNEFLKVVYFGDGEWDYKTCSEIGIEFIGIDSNDSGKLRSLGVTSIFSDFRQPNEIIEVINS